MGTVGLVFLIIGISAAVIVGAVFLTIFLVRRSYIRKVKNLRFKYDDYHTQLVSNCLNMVNRLATLGKSSMNYQKIYESKNEQYNNLLDVRDVNTDHTLTNLERALNDKKYKEVRECYSNCLKEVNIYEMAVTNFSSDLNALLIDDTNTHSASVSVKSKLRQIKEYVSDNVDSLKPIEETFAIVIKNSEKAFNEFDEHADKAKFDEAKAVLDKISTILDEVIRIIKSDSLPYLVSSVYSVLPEKLDSLSAYNSKMISDGYVVEYLNVENDIMAMRKTISKAQEKLTILDIDGVEPEIKKINEKIIDTEVKFQEEIDAKKRFFDEKQTVDPDYSPYNISKRYSKLKNSLNVKKDTYLLDTKYVKQITDLAAEIEVINTLQRELESFTDTSQRRPYVIIIQKKDDIHSRMERAYDTMNDYEEYLRSLDAQAGEIYAGMIDCYIGLKNALALENSIGVPAISVANDEKFNDLFNRIFEISKIIVTTPIDVVSAAGMYAPLVNESKELIEKINSLAREADKAEAAIVYANAYYERYADCRSDLEVAEKAFNEGDFTRAASTAVQIYQRYNVDSSQQTATN